MGLTITKKDSSSIPNLEKSDFCPNKRRLSVNHTGVVFDKQTDGFLDGAPPICKMQSADFVGVGYVNIMNIIWHGSCILFCQIVQ